MRDWWFWVSSGLAQMSGGLYFQEYVPDIYSPIPHLTSLDDMWYNCASSWWCWRGCRSFLPWYSCLPLSGMAHQLLPQSFKACIVFPCSYQWKLSWPSIMCWLNYPLIKEFKTAQVFEQAITISLISHPPTLSEICIAWFLNRKV